MTLDKKQEVVMTKSDGDSGQLHLKKIQICRSITFHD